MISDDELSSYEELINNKIENSQQIATDKACPKAQT